MACTKRGLVIGQISEPLGGPPVIVAQLIDACNVPRRELSVLALPIGLLLGRSGAQPLDLTVEVLHEALDNLDSLDDLVLENEHPLFHALVACRGVPQAAEFPRRHYPVQDDVFVDRLVEATGDLIPRMMVLLIIAAVNSGTPLLGCEGIQVVSCSLRGTSSESSSCALGFFKVDCRGTDCVRDELRGSL